MQAPFTQGKDYSATRVVRSRRAAQRLLMLAERSGRRGVIHGKHRAWCVVWDRDADGLNARTA